MWRRGPYTQTDVEERPLHTDRCGGEALTHRQMWRRGPYTQTDVEERPLHTDRCGGEALTHRQMWRRGPYTQTDVKERPSHLQGVSSPGSEPLETAQVKSVKGVGGRECGK
uniref:Uncharacterized protein n=1 Tax=Knipowitschia caucasica TaxID=637954 RepID=A0AAV2LWF7_KNICA